MAYELPENLSALSPEELQALIDQGLDAFRALNLSADSDEATVIEGERIAEVIKGARAEQRIREQAAASDATRRSRVDALLTQMSDTPTPEPDPSTPETPEGDEPAAPEGEPVTPDAVIPPGSPVPVAASGVSPVRRAAANSTPQMPQRARSSAVASLTAAADVPGIPNGAPLEGLTAAVDAVIRRMRGMPTTNLGNVRHRYGAAMVRKDFQGLDQDNIKDDMSLLAAAADERRLPGGSLVAAGGWCAPSETFYDLCQLEVVDGIIDLPEIGVSRGGIRWTQGPDFSDIYDACGFFLTEAEAIAGTAQKDCCMVECPPFEEIRLDAIGLCVKAPLLTQAAYPELTRRFMEGALVAHAHKVNKYLIDTMVAHAGAKITAGDNKSTLINLEAIGIAALGMRYSYRLAQNHTIEVVAPFWLKALLKAEGGMRAFRDGPTSDAELNSWFSDRNLSVQWVYDYQSLVTDGCRVTIPANVDVLMYPAGTWVRGSLDVINIDAVYDSTGLESNTYTALFMEEGILAVQRCTRTCAMTIPICLSGRMGAADINTCFTMPTGGDTGEPGSGNPAGATGATAGIPGSFTGGAAPASVAALQDGDPNTVVASPATAWTTGQYVQTATAGTGGRAYWNGTAWVAGAAT